MKEICLSAKGLKLAAFVDDQSKFTFVVGKEEREFQRALCLRKSVTFYRTIQLLRDCVFFLIEHVLALI
jgi:hypothetical protein